MLPLSYRCQGAGVVRRLPGFDSGWRSFGETLVAQIRDGGYRIRTATGSHRLLPGMGFLIPPGLRHRVAVVGAEPARSLFVHLHCRVYELRGLFTVLTAPIIFDLEAGRRIGASNQALIACQERGGLADAVAASAHLAELVALAVAACPALESAWDRRERLLPALRHIRDHLDGRITRGDLARTLAVSVPHLHTLFLRAFGTAPMDLVRNERIQHARQLLHWTELPVAEVGRRCGFADQFYFSRAFSRAEGASPSVYRRARRAQDGTGLAGAEGCGPADPAGAGRSTMPVP